MTGRVWDPRRPANLALIIMCACAAVWLAGATLVAVPSADADHQDAAEGHQARPVAPADVNLESFGAIYEQPVFNEGHRPLSTAQPSTEAVSDAGPMTLIGTLGTGARWGATIATPDGLHHAVTEGQVVGGWRIATIGDGFVVIDKDGRSQRLTLYQEPRQRKAQAGQPQ